MEIMNAATDASARTHLCLVLITWTDRAAGENSSVGLRVPWAGGASAASIGLAGRAQAVVTVGLIWGLRHAPVIAFCGVGATVRLAGSGPIRWAVAPFFLLTTHPLGVIS